MIYDEIKNPSHYDGDGFIECKDALRSMMYKPSWISTETGYWWGCAFKYIWRWPFKNGIEDIDKAIRCLEYMRESAVSDMDALKKEANHDKQQA